MEPPAGNDGTYFYDSDNSFDGSKLEKEYPYYDDILDVSRLCYVQTAETRFGSDIGPEIKTFIYGPIDSMYEFVGDGDSDDELQAPMDDWLAQLQILAVGEFQDFELPNGWMPELPASGADVIMPLPSPPGAVVSPLLNNMTDNVEPVQQQVQQGQIQLQPQEALQEVALQFWAQADQSLQDHVQHTLPVDQGHERFPRAQRLRLNLTALSQKYNNEIHVFVPRKVPNILSKPCLVLKPKKLKTRPPVIPAIDPLFGHQINHLMIGNLGHLEVLFFAFDDGDVGAYYTHTIADCILSAKQEKGDKHKRLPHSTRVKEFFHENVGSSAWGLAIHEESRLLAVSSNKAEVTVFAFALRQDQPQNLGNDDALLYDSSPQVWPGQTAFALERDFRTRTRTWKIILPLETYGSNIPNISFCDDEQDRAEFVVAQDITQRTWILDIWRIGHPPVEIWHETNKMNYVSSHNVGWGVMVLPDKCFKETASLHECFGLPPEKISGSTLNMGQIWLDTTFRLHYVPGLAHPHTEYLPRPHSPSFIDRYQHTGLPMEEDMDGESAADEEMDSSDAARTWTNTRFGPVTRRILIERFGFRRGPHAPWESLDDTNDGIHLAQFIVPKYAYFPDATCARFEPFKRWLTTSISIAQCESFSRYAKRNISILLTSTTDVCLLHLDPTSTPQLCRKVLPYHNHHNRHQSPYDLHRVYSQRIGMLLHVPELNLVVLGSLCGRVALLRLTKTAKLFYGAPVRRGFRVEMILPRRLEEDKRMRPWCTLHGIAISPVPHPRSRDISLHPEGEERRRPALKKWRLVLHYLDHTILTYIITESKDNDSLLVV
ncbi:hypothetical protein B0T20DRAFT_454006 [Sordaria brevicollis]|uniref:Uncharacterized protein n=1 Tax=Sordaria brevicollis TaxID=83679 RepID=A0AAE0PDG2_SORBR|nr:hypothetical protein B0T20DRAFT_454006 [Sordaria brevicollis]